MSMGPIAFCLFYCTQSHAHFFSSGHRSMSQPRPRSSNIISSHDCCALNTLQANTNSPSCGSVKSHNSCSYLPALNIERPRQRRFNHLHAPPRASRAIIVVLVTISSSIWNLRSFHWRVFSRIRNVNFQQSRRSNCTTHAGIILHIKESESVTAFPLSQRTTRLAIPFEKIKVKVNITIEMVSSHPAV